MVSKTKRNHENWELPQLVIEPTGSVLADCLREQPGLRVSMVSKFHTSLRGQVTSAQHSYRRRQAPVAVRALMGMNSRSFEGTVSTPEMIGNPGVQP